MITATKLRSGVNFLDGGEPWRVLQYKHTHMSRGAGNVKVKCRNLLTGTILTKSFRGGDRVEEIQVNKQQLQFLYRDGDEFIFMDPVSFEQVSLPASLLDDAGNYLIDGKMVEVLFWDEKPLGVELPAKLEFEIIEAAPGEKGDSASNVYKDAKIETGLKIRVPLFVNKGDRVRVDTRDGSYIERVS